MTTRCHKLSDSFAVLKPDLTVDQVAVTPTIYEELDTRFDNFRGHVLVSEYSFTQNWPTWERHPAGDETVVLLSGEAKMLLRTASGDVSVHLKTPGEYVVVPASTWHTAHVSTPTRMLFITPGESTENSENPD